jgi:hypothetical protein
MSSIESEEEEEEEAEEDEILREQTIQVTDWP